MTAGFAAGAGFLVSLSLIAAIGAQNAFVLRQGIRREHVLAVVLTCALSDAVLIAAGDDWEEALEIAQVQLACGAEVVLGLPRAADVAIAEKRCAAMGLSDKLAILRFSRKDAAGMEAALEDYTKRGTPISGALFLPALGAGELAGKLTEADDSVVEALMDAELAGNMALARTLSRYWKRHDNLLQPPRFVFVSHKSDGNGNVYNHIQRAATEQLIRIWRDESAIDTAHGRRRQAEWGNQIVRFTNDEAENIRFTAGHAARILLKEVPDASRFGVAEMKGDRIVGIVDDEDLREALDAPSA